MVERGIIKARARIMLPVISPACISDVSRKGKAVRGSFNATAAGCVNWSFLRPADELFSGRHA